MLPLVCFFSSSPTSLPYNAEPEVFCQRLTSFAFLEERPMRPVFASRKHGWMIRYSTQRFVLIITPFVNDRNRQGGGVCMYIRKDLAFNALDELSHDDIEAIWIELLLPKTKLIVCGVVYRPPDQTKFYELFESV